ncbi:MAG: TlpA disulfide reductase family protein [Prevotella sp.]|jgi:peroxiredoxin|nr:TlpA disulfide reductase family protein [Prevotella sp.]
MKISITRPLIAVAAAALLSSCMGEKFHVEGNVKNAKDSVLYFEHNGLEGFTVVDSVKLDETGTFAFSGDGTKCPDFYRLRIAGQIINVAIDSTETVSVEASYPMMASNYKVTGSAENEKIRELALSQMALQSRCQALASDNSLSPDSTATAIEQAIDAYKEHLRKNYIYKEPMRAYAYFALFQYIVVNNQARMVFNPSQNRDDVKVFAAVATSWDTYYPGSERGLNLHNIALEGMKNKRIIDGQRQGLVVDQSKVIDSGVIDINLRNNKGQMVSLTSMKGKVVMLDFHLFNTGDESTKRIMMLRELYNKYHARGFEIYQVSVDENEHFWKMQTANLPWVSVFDPDGEESQYLVKYNVQELPTFFLIDRNNQLQKRDVQITDLEAEIEKML